MNGLRIFTQRGSRLTFERRLPVVLPAAPPPSLSGASVWLTASYTLITCPSKYKANGIYIFWLSTRLPKARAIMVLPLPGGPYMQVDVPEFIAERSL